MKNYTSLGLILADLRVSRALSQAELGSILGTSRSTVAAWETGRERPPREIILKIAELAGVRREDTGALLSLAGEQELGEQEHEDMGSPADHEPIDAAINAEAVKDIQVQVKDLSASIDAVGLQLKEREVGEGDAAVASLAEELQNARVSLGRLSASSREITAPVAFPTSSELTVRLVPSTLLERLEEHRGDENRWTTYFGILVGVASTVSVQSFGTGSQDVTGWLLIVVLWCGTVLAGASAFVFRRRASRVREQLLVGKPFAGGGGEKWRSERSSRLEDARRKN